MSAIETQGTRFFWSSSTGLSTTNEIDQVQNWSGLGGASPSIDVTDLGSTAREKIPGLRDPGELSLGLLYNPATDTGQYILRIDAGLRAKRKMCVKWSTTGDANGLGMKFDAYSGGIEINGAEDDVMKGTATIILAGAASETTFAT
jgi:hypothetical protein